MNGFPRPRDGADGPTDIGEADIGADAPFSGDDPGLGIEIGGGSKEAPAAAAMSAARADTRDTLRRDRGRSRIRVPARISELPIDRIVGSREKIEIRDLVTGAMVRMKSFPPTGHGFIVKDGVVHVPAGKAVVLIEANNVSFYVPEDSVLIIRIAEGCQISIESGARAVIINGFVWRREWGDDRNNDVNFL